MTDVRVQSMLMQIKKGRRNLNRYPDDDVEGIVLHLAMKGYVVVVNDNGYEITGKPEYYEQRSRDHILTPLVSFDENDREGTGVVAWVLVALFIVIAIGIFVLARLVT